MSKFKILYETKFFSSYSINISGPLVTAPLPVILKVLHVAHTVCLCVSHCSAFCSHGVFVCLSQCSAYCRHCVFMSVSLFFILLTGCVYVCRTVLHFVDTVFMLVALFCILLTLCLCWSHCSAFCSHCVFVCRIVLHVAHTMFMCRSTLATSTHYSLNNINL